MKHFANDLAHIFFSAFVLWLPSIGLLGYVLSGVFIGCLIEMKEENPNILKVLFKGISWRDVCGYALGGLIVGLIML